LTRPLSHPLFPPPSIHARRLVFVSNHLPLLARRDAAAGWSFEWDEDALIRQAAEGLPEEMEPVYVGCLSVEVEGAEQEVRGGWMGAGLLGSLGCFWLGSGACVVAWRLHDSKPKPNPLADPPTDHAPPPITHPPPPALTQEVSAQLQAQFGCFPVFLGAELKHAFYRRFCKQQLWPVMHYELPLSPSSPARFDAALWGAYVRANMAFCQRLVEVLGSLEDDFVWVHDYHLLVLPSLLRKRFHRVRCGFFLHSPFPSSEVFRTFPRREEVLRSLLNADLVGFHTFDYARHFLSCCSRMLGLEHRTSRGAIFVEYYGRDVGVKIMPTGVKPARLLDVFSWPDTAWRRGELAAQFRGRTVLVGVDDMDVFKGIELKLQAFEQVRSRKRVLETNQPANHSLVTDLRPNRLSRCSRTTPSGAGSSSSCR
jgi:trehalose-6-phosphate synthase